jgi:DeoR/GlpR family transcriptional regulator of sugar metabolism
VVHVPIINELLKRLRGTAERPNISRLAAEFKVSRKTIIRDLHDLIQRGQLDASIYPDWKSASGAETAPAT